MSKFSNFPVAVQRVSQALFDASCLWIIFFYFSDIPIILHAVL